VRLRPALLAGLIALVAAAPAPARGATDPCAVAGEAGGGRVQSDRYVVVFATRPPRIAVGTHFQVEAIVCPRKDAPAPTGLRVDAYMPEHRHGMNYRATVTPRGPARWLADGLLLHMPGRWQLLFDVQADGRTERLVAEVVLD
jgi:hypothetical protein